MIPVLLITVATSLCIGEAGQVAELILLKSETLDAHDPRHGAVYQNPTGLQMVGPRGFSPDNGRTWQPMEAGPDFDADLPWGYRRTPHNLWLDPVSGNLLRLLNCMDTAGKDPTVHEPDWEWQSYYLRYRVSRDGGSTWLFDEPVVLDGDEYSPRHPLTGVYIGKNSFFLGDSGCQPIRTADGAVLVPIQFPPLADDGEGLYNPGGGWYWLDSAVLIGQWADGGRIRWEMSEPISGDPDRTARGLYEPTLAELADGRILCVMRGSNGGSKDPDFEWPSRKWYAVSSDGGHTWSSPEAWTYSDGEPFFSPASMSQLFAHSSGRIFWVGNLSQSNCRANHPRWPLVIGEVDPDAPGLIRETILEIDSKREGESDVNLSHWLMFEDRETTNIVISTDRASEGYRSRTPVLYEVAVR